MILDGIEIKETSGGYALLFEYLKASATLWVIRQEPRSADRNDSWCCRDLGLNVFG